MKTQVIFKTDRVVSRLRIPNRETHDFDTKRAGGTTAGERLFGTPFPDSFDWSIERMGALPVPLKA